MRRRVAAALVLLAIGFLFLVPDPHDHGDAGSLGGLFRPLIRDPIGLALRGPSPAPGADPGQARGLPQPTAREFCPVHFWHQVAATGLLVAFLLRVFLTAEFRPASFAALHSAAALHSFQTRAPPVLS
ncbi:MAG: hypothetical protein ACREJ4_12950 [Candidatus Methylomirabilaceae bacterium]